MIGINFEVFVSVM